MRWADDCFSTLIARRRFWNCGFVSSDSIDRTVCLYCTCNCIVQGKWSVWDDDKEQYHNSESLRSSLLAPLTQIWTLREVIPSLRARRSRSAVAG
jgi:hypothetical protein